MFQSPVKQKPFIISLPHIICEIGVFWTNTAFPPPNKNIVNVHFLSCYSTVCRDEMNFDYQVIFDKAKTLITS